jgi:hypothetical protein
MNSLSVSDQFDIESAGFSPYGNPAATLEVWLRRIIGKAGEEDWIEVKQAVKLHKELRGKGTEEVKPTTFAHYRKSGRGGRSIPGRALGVDCFGYVWRREGKRYRYLKWTVETPLHLQDLPRSE